MNERETRMTAARRSLTGLSVGDAFGERFFGPPEKVAQRISMRAVPEGRWPITDDTVMALSVVDVLEAHGHIHQDFLAHLFAARYRRDPMRGYGSGAHDILQRIGLGEPWQQVSRSAFGGRGSMGNGAAMRAGPIGAYFADDLAKTVEAAHRSAEVTHSHPDGQAGAIAVAVAAAWVAGGGLEPSDFFETVIRHTPAGPTRTAIEAAAGLSLAAAVAAAVSQLGNGARVMSMDTVPFCLWCVARHLGNFEAALWTAVSGLGDRDTTCAIVGGIAALHERSEIPDAWIVAREPLEVMAQ
jgi:ADP-ribosylglycohydrolase